MRRQTQLNGHGSMDVEDTVKSSLKLQALKSGGMKPTVITHLQTEIQLVTVRLHKRSSAYGLKTKFAHLKGGINASGYGSVHGG